jgi:rhodanese-related sulfurtransferase
MQTFTHPFEEARPNRAGYRDITVEAAHRSRGLARLVDVREASELAADGFIAGSEHIPMGIVETQAAGWSDKDQDIILICRSGNRSGRVAEALVRRGFRRVMNMTGGMIAYTAAGLPVARS